MIGLMLVTLVCYSPTASAYLDPGSGSLLFASIFGIFATGFFVLKSAYYKTLRHVGRRGVERTHTHDIVCYSEGSHYWSTFRPLVRSLNRKGRHVAYFTSDRNDVAFGSASELLTVTYIGQGNRAHARLNSLNADVCVLTTPGLDVLQIKRSKGVGQYVHVVHSAMDVHTYKLFSFDYFDAVLCSGQHQIDSIRALEAKRNTKRKELMLTGCLYFDELKMKRCQLPETTEKSRVRRVLVAPTWGKNGLLARFGEELIAALLNGNFEVAIRPHPQSLVVEQDLLIALTATFADIPGLSWDHDPDNFASLSQADIMISDISGVMFDYAFVFKRPVITIAFEPDWRGTESFDLPTKAFELAVLNRIGRQIDPEDIPSLPGVINELSAGHGTTSEIEAIRESMVVNFGRGGDVAARQILSLATVTG